MTHNDSVVHRLSACSRASARRCVSHAVSETIRCVVRLLAPAHVELTGNRGDEFDRFEIRTAMLAITPWLRVAHSTTAPCIKNTALYIYDVGSFLRANGQIHFSLSGVFHVKKRKLVHAPIVDSHPDRRSIVQDIPLFDIFFATGPRCK